jgi:Zn-finger nucleic acid-binding protein
MGSDAGDMGPYRSPSRQVEDDGSEDPVVVGDCPACPTGTLRAYEVDVVEVLRCSACAGHFVTHEAMTLLASERAKQARTDSSGGYAPPRTHPDRTLHCPSCDQPMSAAYFGHGCAVRVDVCADHGTWFDAHELDIALDAVSAGVRWVRPARSEAASPPRPPPPHTRAGFGDVRRLGHALVRAAVREDQRDVEAIVTELETLLGWPTRR